MRFALRQLMLAFAILGAVFALTQSGGCGAPWSYVSHVAYSHDGKWISATLFNGRDARVPGKRYKADIYRTVQLLSADGDSYHTISREFLPGNQGPFHPRDSAPSVRFREHTSEIYVAAWQAKRIDVFDCQTFVKLRTLTAPWTTLGKYGFGIAFAPDAERLYITDEPGVYAISVSPDQPSDWQLISNFGRTQSDLILSASGKYACLHSYFTGSTLVDLRTGQALTSIGDNFESLCFSPTDEELLIALPKKLEFFNPNTVVSSSANWHR